MYLLNGLPGQMSRCQPSAYALAAAKVAVNCEYVIVK